MGSNPSSPVSATPCASYPCLKLKGLPYRVKYQDLKTFFQSADIEIVEYSVVLEKNTDGRPSGIGYVKVPTEAAQRTAVHSLNKKTIPGYDRYVWVLTTSEAEYHTAATTWAGAVISTSLPPAEGDGQAISMLLKQREECRKMKMYSVADDIRRMLRDNNVSFDDELRTWTDGKMGSGRWGPATPFDVNSTPRFPDEAERRAGIPTSFDMADLDVESMQTGSHDGDDMSSPKNAQRAALVHPNDDSSTPPLLSDHFLTRTELDVTRAASSPAGLANPYSPALSCVSSGNGSAFEAPLVTHIQSLLSAVASKTDVADDHLDVASVDEDVDARPIDLSTVMLEEP
eukprot:TRINITY_DN73161_c0_g1_i1.p1 TRINITY_DN73161_c0_g1~~TRINITY_DN73161_c0_g1_i1.p1  ORF type:complete len:362 (+),score=138.08 TRINITY_DN73161_c0_g1_i1:58-1086(+)